MLTPIQRAITTLWVDECGEVVIQGIEAVQVILCEVPFSLNLGGENAPFFSHPRDVFA